MNDFRFALRQLRKNPGFTIVAVIALALGIGANTAIFSVLNAVLLKPLPFPASEQLIGFGGHDKRDPDTTGILNTLAYPDFFDLRERNHSFAQLAAYRDKSFALAGSAEAQSVRGQRVTGDFFTLLGARPILGRLFTRADENSAGPDGLTAVLSYDFWQRQFNGDRRVLGQSLTLDGLPFTIIGVLSAGFQFPIQAEPNELYVSTAIDSLSQSGQIPNTSNRANGMMRCLGRLRPGTTLEQTRAELHLLAAAIEKENPDTNTNWDYIARPLREQLVGNVRAALWILAGAVACVLLIASVNVANLLLARAAGRGREIAVRSALGASRARIIRQLLAESLLLSALGGAVGLLLAFWGTQALITLVPKEIPRAGNIHLDGTVLAFTSLISFVTGILFGLAPAFHATRIDLIQSLKASGRSAIAGGHRSRLGQALIVIEMALALILLVGAGLLLQSFNRLGHAPSGLQSEQLLTARFALPNANYPRPESIANFYEQLNARLRRLPGVRAASTVFPLPMSGSITATSFDLADHPLPLGEQPSSLTRIVGLDYFRTIGIPLRQGRFFSDDDRLSSKQVVMINERFAQKYFPNQNPVGKQMKPLWSVGQEASQMREVIGVVGNARFDTLQGDFAPELYVPVSQIPYPTGTILLRTETSNPEALANTLRNEIAQLDRGLPLTAIRAFDQYLNRSLNTPRFDALLLSLFAGVALLLAAVGIYGVIAYSVSQRTNEIGLRMALGAQPSSIFRLIVGQAMMLVLISIAMGLLGAFSLNRILTSVIYGISASDPMTLVSVASLIAVVAFLACWLPARRAARINPIEALRAE